MRKKSEGLTGLLLVLVMVLTMLPGVALAAEDDVAVNAANFPDANFRSYVETLPGAEDKAFTKEEIAAIVSIDCSASEETADADKISYLTGIEYFTALEKLCVKKIC